MGISYTVKVDFSGNGSFADAGEDITARVKAISWTTGATSLFERIARVGTCEITVDNQALSFSPGAPSFPSAPTEPVGRGVQVTVGGYVVFEGYIRRYKPDAGVTGAREATIECEDMLGVLQDHKVRLPILENVASGTLVKLICSSVFGGGQASATVTFTGLPSDGDTVTIGGKVYTFKPALGGVANQVLMAGTTTTQAALLARAIVNDPRSSGIGYTTNTIRHNTVTATSSGNVVTVKAAARGAWGNSIGLSKSGANITVSAAALAGGTDAPAGKLNVEAGKRTFAVAADTWTEDTSAYRALRDVVYSEWGLCWVEGGTLYFRDADFYFEKTFANASTAPAPTGAMTQGVGEMSIDDVHNVVSVSYTPRVTLTQGVVAKSSGVIKVPGASGQDRWDGLTTYPGAGNAIVRLPFVDRDTGRMVGAKDVITPIASTDYTVNDREDGSGYDYTSGGRIVVSVAVLSDAVEVSFRNTAQGPLYVRGFEVRGKGIVAYNPVDVRREDATSMTSYGRRDLAIDLPLLSNGVAAESLADYLLYEYKTPRFRAKSINWQGGAENTQFYPGLGEIFNLEEGQWYESTPHRMLRLGQTGSVSKRGGSSVTFNVAQIDSAIYFQIDSSLIGGTHVLAP